MIFNVEGMKDRAEIAKRRFSYQIERVYEIISKSPTKEYIAGILKHDYSMRIELKNGKYIFFELSNYGNREMTYLRISFCYRIPVNDRDFTTYTLNVKDLLKKETPVDDKSIEYLLLLMSHPNLDLKASTPHLGPSSLTLEGKYGVKVSLDKTFLRHRQIIFLGQLLTVIDVGRLGSPLEIDTSDCSRFEKLIGECNKCKFAPCIRIDGTPLVSYITNMRPDPVVYLMASHLASNLFLGGGSVLVPFLEDTTLLVATPFHPSLFEEILNIKAENKI